MPLDFPVSKITSLPLHHREKVVPEYLDHMGHMNVQFYLYLYTQAIPKFYASLGMDKTYFATGSGFFTLNHCITYYAEVRVDETVVIHSRVLGYAAKRLHFMFFMVNESTGRLASTLEELDSHADLTQRRTSPFPESIVDRIQYRLGIDSQLDWEVALCGVLQP